MALIKFDLYKVFDHLKEVDYESLYQYFKTNYKQSLFVKTIDTNLLLIHNNIDKSSDNDLYYECRSIVINTTNKLQPVIVSYSHDNISYLTSETYTNLDTDIIEESYEGTMVSVYNNNDKWYFSSTRCPSIDNSYFFNKDKSHGKMLNEILEEYFPDTSDVRNEFVKHLNPDKTYYFIIIHYENKYLVDYSLRYGPEYKKLMHIITRNKTTQIELSEKLDLPVLYPEQFNNIEDLSSKYEDDTEGVIIKRKDNDTNKISLIKIPSVSYMTKRQEKPNYNNPLVSCIDIFQKNNPKYKPEQFLEKYYPDLKINNNKIEYDITGILYLIMKNLALEINIVYNYFTHFDKIECKFVKRNTTLYQNICMQNKYKILRNCINRLQNYQIKHLKRPLFQQDFIDHLRKYTSPSDIYRLMTIHNDLMLEKSELYKIIETNMPGINKYNLFIKLYTSACTNDITISE